MTDRYTKSVLTVIALCLVVLAVDAVFKPLPTVRAQSPGSQKRCVWTAVIESGKASLGQNGEVKLGREWQAASNAGWELKAAVWTGAATGYGQYIFERCEVR